MRDKKLTGREGEDEAACILKIEGYKILARNYRSSFGEIDIIAEDKGCLVFVEVKRRNGNNFGSSLEAINAQKKLHLIRCAQTYLKANRCLERKVRFDVVGIDDNNVTIIKNAFGDDRT